MGNGSGGGGGGGVMTTKANKNPHFIHEAIERKIERFSRQRSRGATNTVTGSLQSTHAA